MRAAAHGGVLVQTRADVIPPKSTGTVPHERTCPADAPAGQANSVAAATPATIHRFLKTSSVTCVS